MFHSLRAKISFLVALIMAVTAGAVMFFTHRDVGAAISLAEEESAVNVLRFVELTIRAGYDQILADKVGTVQTRKKQLRNQADLTVSVFRKYHEAAQQGIMPAATARTQAIEWLKSVPVEQTAIPVVFDATGVVQVCVDSRLPAPGTSLGDLADIKGRKIRIVMQPDELTYGGDYAVFEGAQSEGRRSGKKIGYFAPFADWQWTIGMLVDISDVEAEAEQKLATIMDVLEKTFRRIQITDTGFAFVFNGKGELLIAPPQNQRRHYLAASVGAPNPILQTLMQAAQNVDKPVCRFTVGGDRGRAMEAHALYFKPLDWYAAVVVPIEEIERPARTLVTRQILIIAIVFCGAMVLAFVVVSRISHPLRRLSEYANALPQQDFTTPGEEHSPIEDLPRRYKDEVGKLAESFVFMSAQLRENIRALVETLRSKQHIESELHIAHDIQMGLLPRSTPGGTPDPRYDLAARLDPAKEVGGDLYDYFTLEDRYLCLAIGDVAGKGVPAALFMAITKTMIKAAADRGLRPAEMMTYINSTLCRENPSSMFVTLFIALLDLTTGHFVYANGGHNWPVIVRQNRQVSFLDGRGGPVVGALEDITFQPFELVLEPGDTILFYTDGVTEAMNNDGAMYTKERLVDLLAGASRKWPRDLVSDVAAAVLNHADGAVQSDDIAILCVKYLGA